MTDKPTVPCTSISALASAPGRVLAGCGGSTSSEMGADWNSVNSGDWGGVMQSVDGGATWSRLTGFPANYYVSTIAVLPSAILVGAWSHLYDRDRGGIWPSTDGGHSFALVLAQPVFNLLVAPAASDSPLVLAALPFPKVRLHSSERCRV